MSWIEKADVWMEFGGMKKVAVLLFLSGVGLLADFFGFSPTSFEFSWVAILFCGIPIVWEAFHGLWTAFDVKADVLVACALVASLFIGETFAAGEIAFIMKLGELLEEWTVRKARNGIEKLVQMTPRVARVVEGERQREIPIDDVKEGDLLDVFPGEMIPVDGVVVEGQTTIDQSLLTGEPVPVDKDAGDAVFSGTLNQFGAFRMRALRVGKESSIQRMAFLVQAAEAEKAPIVRIADRWAAWIVGVALTAAVLCGVLTGEIIRSVTILVVFCPCALVLATPTAIAAAIGNAAKFGCLPSDGAALERLADVDRIALDKTGTLTRGRPEVTRVESLIADFSESELVALAAAVEQGSEHPLGKTILAFANEKRLDVPRGERFQIFPGQGARADVQGRTIWVGRRTLVARQLALGPEDRAFSDSDVTGGSVVWIAFDGRLAGKIVLQDAVREEAAEVVERLKRLNVAPFLLTGDARSVAENVASRLGIGELRAECLPEEKLLEIDRLQKEGATVCMVGDGINDAPALKKADVGIAMGGVGRDLVADAADLVLASSEIRELPRLFALARRMMKTIRLNIAFSMTLNFLAISLAAAGALDPVAGALVHNAGSVAVIVNSAILMKWRPK